VHKKVSLAMIIAVLALAMVLVPLAGAQGAGTSIAGGLNAPMGVFVDEDGNVWVIDSGVGGDTMFERPSLEGEEAVEATLGDTTRVVKIAPDGTQAEVATLPSVLMGQEATGGARVVVMDGVVYATNGQWEEGIETERPANVAAVVKIEDGEVSELANFWAFEQENNPDPNRVDSHPYGLAIGPGGSLWVAEAGGNYLAKVDPATGDIETVAVIEGVPSPLENPTRGGRMETDPVPTGVAFDDAGNAYVSSLPGVPFVPGSARVLKVTPSGEVSEYATDLTMLTDLRRGPDGNLYAVQLAVFTEEGPTPNSGAIVRVGEGDTSEVVVGDLPFPSSIAFNAAGDAYVTVNTLAPPGSGEVVVLEGLATPGEMAETMEQPEQMPTTGAPQAPIAAMWLLLAGAALLAAGYARWRTVAATHMRR
jgi:sugar lactone lactonase YvrE